LYSASMTLLGGQAVGYYLNEETGWSVTVDELERAVSEFRQKGGTPRMIAIINPGNPTGQVLSREVMEGVLKFAEKEKIALMADEVYQDNIHADDSQFLSFRKLARDLGVQTEIFSFHSVSKGVTGECGLRGGLVHCENVKPEVMDQLYKLSSISLCSNVLGQALMASVLAPPPAGGLSRASFDQERTNIHEALKRKAKRVTERLNSIDGISCQPIQGAMYAFPSIQLDKRFVEKARAKGIAPDELYCLGLVERTGIITVPGSGFGQRPGSWHIRLTILPDEVTLEKVLDDLESFHRSHADYC